MKNLILALTSFIFFITNCFGQSNLKDFKIYNALLYKNTPDLNLYGFKDIYLFYEDDLNFQNKTYKEQGRTINKSAVIYSAKKALQNPNIPVCLDIESWPLDGKYKNESRNNYLAVLNLFKQYNKKSKVGYFGVFPMDSPHADYSFNSKIRESIIMPKWQSTNNYFKDVGKAVDVYFPVFYTRFKDHGTWVKIVKEKVSKIREVNKSAKIYGFIWPQYYSNNGIYNFIEQDVWRKQLEIMYEYCDGVVIWSHYKGPNGKIVYFSKDMPWFKTTVDFMRSKNIK